MEYGGGGGLGRKMSQMQVRAYRLSICSVVDTYLMAHDRKWSACTMLSYGMTVG